MNDLTNFPKMRPEFPGVIRLELPTPGDPARYWFTGDFILIAYQLPGDFMIVATSDYRDGKDFDRRTFARIGNLIHREDLQRVSKLGLSGPEFLDRFNHDHPGTHIFITVYGGLIQCVETNAPDATAYIIDTDKPGDFDTDEEIEEREARNNEARRRRDQFKTFEIY